MLGSYSIVVPVCNNQGEIAATLRSISKSMAFFDAHHPRAGDVRGEIIVVDDGSADGTVEQVRAQRDDRVRIVRHRRRFGAGAARNTGVRAAGGDVLFFCDGDDLYLPEHVFVGFSILDLPSSRADSSTGTVRLRVGDRGHLVVPAPNRLAAVRTGIRFADAIHPYWTAAIRNTLLQCLCVRRECHEWIEGLPEEVVYRLIGGCEDAAYSEWLAMFFRVGLVDLETVEYIRVPGNSFDLQWNRFVNPPGSEFDAIAPAERPLHAFRSRWEERRRAYLLDKWCVLGAPSLPPECLNWDGVVVELLQRARYSDAMGVAEEAGRQGQALPAELMEAVRTTCQTAPVSVVVPAPPASSGG
jgi:hypothetical protein